MQDSGRRRVNTLVAVDLTPDMRLDEPYILPPQINDDPRLASLRLCWRDSHSEVSIGIDLTPRQLRQLVSALQKALAEAEPTLKEAEEEARRSPPTGAGKRG